MMTPRKLTRVAAVLLTVAAPVNLLIALLTLAVLVLFTVAGMAAVIGFIEDVNGAVTVTLPRS
jgi:hypothetical protein